MATILDIGMILAILNFYVAPMPPIKFLLNLTYGLGGDVLWRISGGHLRYQNGTILAILNLYVTLMPPIKFQLNPTYSLGDVVWNFKMAAMVAILDMGMEQF